MKSLESVIKKLCVGNHKAVPLPVSAKWSTPMSPIWVVCAECHVRIRVISSVTWLNTWQICTLTTNMLCIRRASSSRPFAITTDVVGKQCTRESKTSILVGVDLFIPVLHFDGTDRQTLFHNSACQISQGARGH